MHSTFLFFIFITEGGCLEMAIKTSEIKKELMSRINEDSAMEVEKVQRYCDFVDVLRELQEKLKEQGVISVTKNGSQEFTKAHPALNEINKINSQLLNIEKSFGFDDDTSVTDKVSLV